MIVTTIVPDGVVMAADSSLITFKMMDMENFIRGNAHEAIKNTATGACAHKKENIVGSTILSKSICKLHVMKGNNIVIADGNQRNFNNKSLSPYIQYFCSNNHYDNPKSCSIGLYNFIKELGQNIDAVYHLCGYNHEKKIPSPEFYYVEVKNDMIINAARKEQCGISFCGANEYFSQYAPLINKKIASYSLQDAVDVSLFAIEMSMKLERFIDRDALISPPIDLLAIEPSGVKWIQQKTLKTEGCYGNIR